MLGGIHGDDEAKVYKELCQAVEEWIDLYEQDGEPLPEATAGKEACSAACLSRDTGDRFGSISQVIL